MGDEMQSNHENLSRRDKVKIGSEKSFGFVFSAFFAIIGFFPLIEASDPNYWAFSASALFLACSIIMPNILRPFNVIWFRFGLLIHSVVNPVIISLMFFLIFTPFALVFRVMGRKFLERKIDHKIETYWISRSRADDAVSSMADQF